jgi:hypothetical protein
MTAAPPRSPAPMVMRPLAGGSSLPVRAVVAAVLAIGIAAGSANAQCPEAPSLANYTGSAQVVCPCFIVGEQAGAVLAAPSGDYPLQVLRVGIAWASQFGGSPQTLEQAINVFAGGLPDPGSPIFSLPGPVMTDGFINEFDLSAYDVVVNSGVFTITLEFLNQNSGDIFAPSVAHDGNGCQTGKNVVYVQPGGWSDACPLGVSGDWVFYVIYRPCAPGVGVGQKPGLLASQPVTLTPARPNPFRNGTAMDFLLAREGPANVSVYDVSGRRLAVLADGFYTAGAHHIAWDGRTADGTPAASGVYFVELRSGTHRARRTLLLAQ